MYLQSEARRIIRNVNNEKHYIIKSIKSDIGFKNIKQNEIKEEISTDGKYGQYITR